MKHLKREELQNVHRFAVGTEYLEQKLDHENKRIPLPLRLQSAVCWS